MQTMLRWIALWCLATLAATSAAFLGVQVVASQVTEGRPAPLTAAQIRSALPDDGGKSPTTSTTTLEPDATTSTSTSTTVGSSGSSTTAAPRASAPAETRSYNLVGGSVALRFSADGVTVVFANPKDGFSVTIEPEHGNGVKVEFRGGDHRSRVDGWWESGPVDRVREDAD